ncbi:hypothetical protein BC943DRAFT_332639 [Umbelopsis sp. AD052]|nr:hypothetical protein BC943DRAFT_332639 [Umbelopsis sp. AD052]
MAHYRRPSTTSSGPHVRELETQELYREAFDVACHAVQLDNSGMHAEAREAYIDAIQLLDRLLIQKSDSNHEGERQLIIQKSQEYSSRAEQLYRYSFTAVISSHPDASQHAITHDRKSHKGKVAGGPLDSKHPDNDQSWVPKSDIDILMEKAYFTLDQAILNEEKDFTDHSLELYKDAASNFLKVYRKLPKDDPRCHNCHELCMQALNKVEELKKSDTTNGLLAPQKEFSPSISSASSSHNAKSITNNHGATPLGGLKCKEDENSMKKLSSAEIEILKLTSNVNSKLFLPWVDESDLREKFTYDELFIDPDGSLPLSALQRAKFGGWKRPSEIMRNPKMIELVSSSALVQDVVTDCSFVASLCVSAAYERKFRKQLITSCIYPQNKFGQPCYNPSGKYMIKLHYNGIKRKVLVDDLLPVSRDGTLMCTFSTNHEELWAPIIEKAYMKLMGGYDFPGSNSGIDLYTLTGWIPEHIFVEDKDFVANNVWHRLMGGQKYGDVLVTISTGEMSEESAAERGLVPTHAYAVIDIREVNGVRFMQVKNPWSHLRWKGPYSHMDTERWNPELMKALNYDPSSAMQFDDGIFWIDFESVCENFVSIHLNWNPELFMYRWALHIPWHCDVGPKKDTYNLGYNPQFKLVVKVPEKKTSAVWLLMSKHITVTEPKNTDFITLHVYNDTNGERVYHHGKAFKEGTYVNSPHILIRFNAPSGTSTYTIVFSQHEKLKTLYFSLKAFSFSQFELTDVPQTYSIEQKISGRWTDQSSGGNASNASFMNNPQWKLTIPPPPESNGQQKCGIIIMLEAPKTFAIHLLLVEGGKRVASFSPREVVSQTNSYQHGFCCCELRDIKPGSYTIIASTYEPGLVGDFLLTIASNTQYTVDSIPVEGAGMFRKVINGEWIVGYNAMGCSTYRNYHRNPRYHLEIRELTTVRVRLQTDGIEPIPPTNVTIYEKHPTAVFGREIATSGPYTNVVQGVATGDTVLTQNAYGYVIVFATHQKDVAGKFISFVYSDRPVNVRPDKITPM